MNDERLAEIERRAAHSPEDQDGFYCQECGWGNIYAADVPELLAEVRQLRALLAALVKEMPSTDVGWTEPVCAYCLDSHAKGCPWLAATAALEAGR
jgi:hypothetical protein